MLHDKQLITIDSAMWEAIGERAAEEALSPEDWLRRQLQASNDNRPGAQADPADEVMFELVVRHFRDQALDRDEQRRLAAALSETLDGGVPCRVGPIGVRQCHYQIHRRTSAVRIRVGEGMVSLPLAQAMRLVALLDGDDEIALTSLIAA